MAVANPHSSPGEFLDSVFAAVPLPVYVIDADSYRIVRANAAAGDKAVVGRTCHEVTHSSPVPCSAPAHVCPLAEAKRTGQPVIAEHFHVDGAGKKRSIRIHGFPIRDDAGRVVQMIECDLDLTDLRQKERELERAKAELEIRVAERTVELENTCRELKAAHARQQETQAQLLHADKLATIGELAAGFSHEFKNRLAVISSAAYYLQGCVPAEDAGARKSYEHITDEIERATRMINDLLQFSRAKTLRLEQVKLAQPLEQTLALLDEPVRRQHISVEKRLAPDLPAVWADADQLLQAFMNLMLNAVQAMPTGGTLTITTEAVQHENGRPAGARILIADTGAGIPDEIRERIFNPFFTTKTDQAGAGLGLTLSQGIVTAHGGTIKAASRTGRGSEFSVFIPVGTGRD